MTVNNNEAEALDLIQSQYERYFQAFANRNVDEAMTVVADDFTWKSGDTVLDRKQTQEALIEHLAGLVSVDDMNISIEDLELKGDEAIVTGIETLVSTSEDETGDLVQSVSRETYRDQWVKTQEGWKLQVSELLDA